MRMRKAIVHRCVSGPVLRFKVVKGSNPAHHIPFMYLSLHQTHYGVSGASACILLVGVLVYGGDCL